MGVFWLVGRALLIDKTPLAEAERYGNNLTNPRNHTEVWEQWQKSGRVSGELEYDHQPRGRVTFDTISERFWILADKCILKRNHVIAKIRSELNLPKGTRLTSDSHYRCYRCLYRTDDQE